jgi:cbb3-type cytochrome oxidase subunit 3
MILLSSCSPDTLNVVVTKIQGVSNNVPTVSIVFSITTIVISLISIWLSYSAYKYTKRQKKTETAHLYLNELVLKYKLPKLYELFEDLRRSTGKLKEQNAITEDFKKQLNDKVETLFIEVRLEFIEAVGAIDTSLQEKIQAEIDSLQEKLTHAICDEGLNLNVAEKYKTEVLQPIEYSLTNIIRMLYTYLNSAA